MNSAAKLEGVITGEIKSQVDKVWNTFWTGGISNPIEIIEQVTYLLFLKRLDEAQTRAEKQALRTGKTAHNLPFPLGNDELGRPWSDLRWKNFKDLSPEIMFKRFNERVFTFLREELPTNKSGEATSYAKHLEGARFTIPTANVLGTVVDIISAMDMSDKDTKGDLYEYMLSKLSTAGTNGQFRTPATSST